MQADCTKKAIDMYNNAGKWEQAHKVRTSFDNSVINIFLVLQSESVNLTSLSQSCSWPPKKVQEFC